MQDSDEQGCEEIHILFRMIKNTDATNQRKNLVVIELYDICRTDKNHL
jgi:hypothetical protein